jgi:hypothetical protein
VRVARFIYGNTYRWKYNYPRLRQPKAKGPVPQHNVGVHAAIISQLTEEDYRLHDYTIDLEDFRDYLRRANYSRFPSYYGGGRSPSSGNFTEKALEHYLAAKLLDLRAGDVYVDVANDESPTPEIYSVLYGCKSYRQDLKFPPGIHGDTIGGSAASMPVPGGFATKMALHCSFEHFEGDADTCFIKEANRVLGEGGRLCIVPLYLHTQYSIQTDPAVLPKGSLTFEPDAILYCARFWGNRHGRIYDVVHLTSRIRSALDDLHLTIYVVKNEKAADPSCYAKFVGLFEKTRPDREPSLWK